MDTTFKVAGVGLSRAVAGICYCQCSPDDLNAVESAAIMRNQYRVAMTYLLHKMKIACIQKRMAVCSIKIFEVMKHKLHFGNSD